MVLPARVSQAYLRPGRAVAPSTGIESTVMTGSCSASIVFGLAPGLHALFAWTGCTARTARTARTDSCTALAWCGDFSAETLWHLYRILAVAHLEWPLTFDECLLQPSRTCSCNSLATFRCNFSAATLLAQSHSRYALWLKLAV